MRMDKGKPFMHIEEEAPMPDLEEIRGDSERARTEGFSIPVFSEMFLYPRVGKDDARFILGVAEEYQHVIEALGPEAVRAILGVKTALVQRLGTGTKIVEWLKDARSDEDLRRSEQFPSQVTLDDNAAEAVWKILHDEYVRHFDPEKTMDSDHLRTYHMLTDSLGQWEKAQRQKERDRLPEKLKKQEGRKEQIDARRERRKRVDTICTALEEGANVGEHRDDILALLQEVRP